MGNGENQTELQDIFEDPAYWQTFQKMRSVPDELKRWYAWDAMRMLRPRDSISILDVGVGNGQFIRPLTDLAKKTGSHARLTLLDRSAMTCEALRHLKSDDFAQYEIIHGDFDTFAADERSRRRFDVVFLSETAHLLGSWQNVLRSICGLLSEDAVAAVRLATREQVFQRSWFKWYPDARDIDEDRHPSLSQLVDGARAVGLNGSFHTVDESRWVTAEQYRSLLTERSFSALRLIGATAHEVGTAQMLTDTEDVTHVWLEYPMTWFVATTKDGPP